VVLNVYPVISRRSQHCRSPVNILYLTLDSTKASYGTYEIIKFIMGITQSSFSRTCTLCNGNCSCDYRSGTIRRRSNITQSSSDVLLEHNCYGSRFRRPVVGPSNYRNSTNCRANNDGEGCDLASNATSDSTRTYEADDVHRTMTASSDLAGYFIGGESIVNDRPGMTDLHRSSNQGNDEQHPTDGESSKTSSSTSSSRLPMTKRASHCSFTNSDQIANALDDTISSHNQEHEYDESYVHMKRMYDHRTWNMYHRIMDARDKSSSSASCYLHNPVGRNSNITTNGVMIVRQNELHVDDHNSSSSYLAGIDVSTSDDVVSTSYDHEDHVMIFGGLE
jgi:hypothetical protein